MSTFGGLMFTNKGRNLQAKAQTGVQLQFTKISLGDGPLNGSAIADLTNLKKTVVNLPIERLRTLSGGRAEVAGILSNQSLTSGFYYRELGLFAMDPQEGEILYCYGNSGNLAEYIPASGGADVIEKQIVIQTIVGNATNITAVIDTSLVYATVSDMNLAIQQNLTDSKEYTNNEIDTLEDQLIALETKLGDLGQYLQDEEKADLVALIASIKQEIATHLADNTKHITADERKNWNEKAPASHSHTISNVTGLQNALDAKLAANLRNVPNGFVGLDANGAPEVGFKRIKLFEVDLSQNPSATVSIGNLTNFKDFVLEIDRVKHSFGSQNTINVLINNLSSAGDYWGHTINGNTLSGGSTNRLASIANIPATSSGVSKVEIDYSIGRIRGNATTTAVNNANIHNQPVDSDYLVVNDTIKTVDSIQVNIVSGQMNSGKILLWGVPK